MKDFKKASSGNHIPLLLFCIVLLGAFLRIYRLDYKSLWMDEMGQVLTAMRGSVLEVIAESSSHLSPPLDYIILHYFLFLGNTDFIVRLPAAIFGTLSIIMAYRLGKVLFGEKEGLVSALLLSVSPIAVWYSQEARMYSLFMFLSLLSLFFFITALQKKNDMWWLGFVFSTVLCLYTHYFAFFVVLNEMLIFVFLLYRNRPGHNTRPVSFTFDRNTILSFILSIVIIFSLFTPYIGVFANQTEGFRKELEYGLAPDASFFTNILGGLGFHQVDTAPPVLGSTAAGLLRLSLLLLFMLTFFCGTLAGRKGYEEQNALVLIWVMVPVVFSFILSYYMGPMTTTRNMIFILPVFLLGISKGITVMAGSINSLPDDRFGRTSGDRLMKNRHTAVVLIILLVFAGIGTASIFQGYERQKEDWRGTSEYLSAHVRGGELVVTFQDLTNHLGFYYTGDDVDLVVLTKDTPGSEFLRVALEGYDKIWFVSSPYSGVDEELLDWLDSNCVLERAGVQEGSGGQLEKGAIYSMEGEYRPDNRSSPGSNYVTMSRIGRSVFTR